MVAVALRPLEIRMHAYLAGSGNEAEDNNPGRVLILVPPLDVRGSKSLNTMYSSFFIKV